MLKILFCDMRMCLRLCYKPYGSTNNHVILIYATVVYTYYQKKIKIIKIKIKSMHLILIKSN